MDIRVKASPILKSSPKNKSDQSRLLILSVRIYKNQGLFKRMNYYVSDKDKPVYLLPNELKNGAVVGEKSMRYNKLIKFTKDTLEIEIKNELNSKVTLNLDVLKERVRNAVLYDFDLNYADELNKELTTLDVSGYTKGESKITVDRRVAEALKNTKLPDQPQVDPLGQVDFNDMDAGDIDDLARNLQGMIEDEARKSKINKLSPEIRYKRNLYNVEDIFELFGSIYYDDKIPNTYDKIVIRMFEYLHYQKPPRHTQTFNQKWIENFLKFLWQEGYSKVSTRNFDPLNFNPDIFLNKTREKYNSDNLYKLFEIIKTLTRRFVKKGLLTPIEFSNIQLSEICGKHQDKKGKRKNQNLIISEFNQLFQYQFDKKKTKEYNEFFQKYYDKSTQQITIDDLATARDMFCLQVMAGGLRGYRELQTVKFLKDDDSLTFHMDKVNFTLINPLNEYTRKIAERTDYQLPRLNFTNSENTLEHIYRALLKTIAEIIPFNRSITVKGHLIKIKEKFNPFFARKTFVQLMYDEFNFTIENISSFTGHVIENLTSKSTLVNNYLDTQSPVKKRELSFRIALPNKEIEGFWFPNETFQKRLERERREANKKLK